VTTYEKVCEYTGALTVNVPVTKGGEYQRLPEFVIQVTTYLNGGVWLRQGTDEIAMDLGQARRLRDLLNLAIEDAQ
jgi:hypothetical protein